MEKVKFSLSLSFDPIKFHSVVESNNVLSKAHLLSDKPHEKESRVQLPLAAGASSRNLVFTF